MDFGFHLGTRGVGQTPDGLRRLAQHLEAHGFAYLGLNDHVVTPAAVASSYPYSESGVWPAADTGTCLEQLVTLGYLAAVTERIRLLTSVMVLPHRAPVLAAKMLSTIDVLSKGRLTIGVGVGWMAEEMAALQSPSYAERGAASEEYLAAFRSLWSESVASYSGDHVSFDGVLFDPKPVQRPHPPIWVGGEAKVAQRRAATFGDGWYPVIGNPRIALDRPQAFAAALAEVRGLAAARGRDGAALDSALFVPWYRLDTEADSDPARRVFTGSAEQIAADVGAYRDAGLAHLIIGFECPELCDALERTAQFAEQVVPLIP